MKNVNNKKGQLLEKVVAILHEHHNVNIKRNVMISPIDREGKKREIDILLTSIIAGYPIKIPIECKNNNKKVGSPEIDAYIGKLQDIGLPVQQSIYVSVNGYTKGALERAKKAGIRTLTFKGLTTSGESLALFDALQSLIYVVPVLKSFSVVTNAETWDPNCLVFHDKDDKYAGTIADLILNTWNSGQIPMKLGIHKLNVNIPNDWKHKCENKLLSCVSINVELNLIGFMILIEGKADEKMLINSDNNLEKFHTEVKFNTKSNYPVYVFDNDESLNKFWDSRHAKVKVSLGKVPLPRVRFGNFYWPLSKQARKEFSDFYSQTRTEDEFKVFQEKLIDLEKNYFESAWFEV